MKLGRVPKRYFANKFGVDLESRFSGPLSMLRERGLLVIEPDWVKLKRDGLLQVDKLLHEFFLPEHRNVRYA
jgi:oxygen-independent coproporphyrinogen-3 oxidase